MAHGSSARLAIRSRASDCLSHRTRTIPPSGSQPHNHSHNRALQSSSSSTPTSHKNSPVPWHTRATHYGKHPPSCSSCQQQPPVRQARRRVTRSVPRQGARMSSRCNHGAIVCSSTRLERVSVREAAWWLQLSELKILVAASSPRCEIECFKTRCPLPGPRISMPRGRVHLHT